MIHPPWPIRKYLCTSLSERCTLKVALKQNRSFLLRANRLKRSNFAIKVVTNKWQVQDGFKLALRHSNGFDRLFYNIFQIGPFYYFMNFPVDICRNAVKMYRSVAQRVHFSEIFHSD